MRNVNNVNNLDGTNWLKNAINFWNIDDDSIESVYDKFEKFCYKDRTGSLCLKNIQNIIDKESDFSFNYLNKFEDFKQIASVIIHGSYNSYHVVYFDNEFIEDFFVPEFFTSCLSIDGIEYRGKIIVRLKNGSIKYALLFLNRFTNDKNHIIPNEPIRINHVSNTINFVINSKSKIDKIGLKHPAPYSYIDINKLCEIEEIKDKTILDPFLGVGSTIIGTYQQNYNIGIELNEEYINLIKDRFEFLELSDKVYKNSEIICGDSMIEVGRLRKSIDAVITSPPYFNILKNKTSGVRTDNSQSRQGIEYYSDNKLDLGNIDNYFDYISAMQKLFGIIRKKMSNEGVVYLIISDFTVNKKEKDVHSDFVKALTKCGFKYAGTGYLFQNQKAIYPFGYPYKIVLNHIYQYVIKFEVD